MQKRIKRHSAVSLTSLTAVQRMSRSENRVLLEYSRSSTGRKEGDGEKQTDWKQEYLEFSWQ